MIKGRCDVCDWLILYASECNNHKCPHMSLSKATGIVTGQPAAEGCGVSNDTAARLRETANELSNILVAPWHVPHLRAAANELNALQSELTRTSAHNAELIVALEDCLKSMKEIGYGDGNYRAMFRASKVLKP